MPNPSLPSNSLCAAVRAHFGLTQAELGRWLSVSAGMVGHLEAGRKPLTAALGRRLRPLALLLPPAAGGLGPEPPPRPDPLDLNAPPPPGPLAAAPLRARLRRVRHLAGTTRFELEGRQGLAGLAARRAWGLAVLAALLAPPPSTAPTPAALAPDPVLTADPAAAARWLARLHADTAAAPVPLTPSQHALLALRLRLLLAEADALETLLAAPGPAPE
ncbi:transcriptional regulator with XRE-family HTH domain [Hymenobacter sp. UYAg731]